MQKMKVLNSKMLMQGMVLGHCTYSVRRQVDIFLCKSSSFHICSNHQLVPKIKQSLNSSLYLPRSTFKYCFHTSSVSSKMIINPRGPGSKYCSPPRTEVLESYLKETFRENTSLSVKEWDGLRDTLRLEFLDVNETNFDSVVMKVLETESNYPLAASFMNYLKETSVKPNLVTCMKYMKLCGRNRELSNQDEILKIYGKLKDYVESMPVLDTTTVSCIVEGLCATDQWEKAFEFFHKVPKEYRHVVSTKDALACAALRNKNESLGWNIITTWYRPTESCHSRVYEEYMRFALLYYKQNPAVADSFVNKLFNHLQKKRVVVKSSLAKDVLTYFKSHREKWNIKSTKVDEIGICGGCSQLLDEVNLSPREFSLLRETFLQRAVKKSDVYINSTEKEFRVFSNLIDNHGHFDFVVDGLNVAFVNHDTAYRKGLASMLLDVVERLSSNSILVIGRYHMKKWPRHLMRQVMNRCEMFFANDSSEDDPFLIYAALASGPKCVLVSSDLMRDHISRLDDLNLIQLFERWRQSHQMYVFHNEKGLQFMRPIKHEICIQGNMKDGWHIPYDDGFLLEPYEVINNWLCIQRSS